MATSKSRLGELLKVHTYQLFTDVIRSLIWTLLVGKRAHNDAMQPLPRAQSVTRLTTILLTTLAASPPHPPISTMQRISFHSACHLLTCWIIPSTLKMEAICSSETSVATQQTTRRHIPDDDTLHNHHHGNLKSYRFPLLSHLFSVLQIRLT
jgi:hypothetical protein